MVYCIPCSRKVPEVGWVQHCSGKKHLSKRSGTIFPEHCEGCNQTCYGNKSDQLTHLANCVQTLPLEYMITHPTYSIDLQQNDMQLYYASLL